jgi:NAD(P)-dependent dehydrogenase (short-subunit alcohol dehydrogenase family)
MPVADFSLEGKAAVVTGGSRGIGRAIALALAEHGASVAVAARKPADLEEAVEAVLEAGGRVIGVATNVRRSEELANLVAKTQDAFGRLDFLVNNAATATHYGPIHTLEEGAFDAMWRTNVAAAHLLSNLAREAMLLHGEGGAIVNVGSVGGIKASDVIGGYDVTKAALHMLTQVQAKTWGRDRIRVNAIAPGLVKTEFARALWENPATLAMVERESALGRMGTPEEVAGAAVYLCSPAAAWVTGQVFVVDGGRAL